MRRILYMAYRVNVCHQMIWFGNFDWKLLLLRSLSRQTHIRLLYIWAQSILSRISTNRWSKIWRWRWDLPHLSSRNHCWLVLFWRLVNLTHIIFVGRCPFRSWHNAVVLYINLIQVKFLNSLLGMDLVVIPRCGQSIVYRGSWPRVIAAVVATEHICAG